MSAAEVTAGMARARRSRSCGVVERNSYLVKRYGFWELAFFVWTVANTLTIVFIAKGVEANGGHLDVERQAASLLIGAVIWSYLGIIFEILTETVAWERWEGTIEYTFMAPLARAVHLLGMGDLRRPLRAGAHGALFAVVALFFGLAFPHADFARRARAAGGGVGLVRRASAWSPRSCRWSRRRRGPSSASSPRACCWSSRASTTRST